MLNSEFVKIRQHATFRVVSEFMPAAEITAELGVEPDQIRVRGARSADPPRPVLHSWEVRSTDHERRVDDLVTALISRLAPYGERIGELALRLEQMASSPDRGGSVLSVVRYFDDEEGEEDDERIHELPDGTRLERLPGQHQLLGWYLDQTVIQFLHITHAGLNVDEYG